MSKSFSEFTNEYSLSKTLRFELRPVGKTGENIRKENELENDEQRWRDYIALKPVLDDLHREFIEESLNETRLSFDDSVKHTKKNKNSGETETKTYNYSSYFDLWVKNENSKNKKSEDSPAHKDALKEKNNALRKEIVKLFNDAGNEWKSKYVKIKKNKEPKKEGYKILLGKNIADIVSQKYPDEKNKIEKFKGFTGALIKFQETRENFYTDKAQGTAIANRIINENLNKFCANIKRYQAAKKAGVSFSHLKKEVELDEVFAENLKFYNKYFLQSGIDSYKEDIVGEINIAINEYNQKEAKQKNKDNTEEKQKPKLKSLITLDKQIIGKPKENKKAEQFKKEIHDDQELRQRIDYVLEENQKRIKIACDLLKDFFEKPQYYDLSQVYLATRRLNSISLNLYENYAHGRAKSEESPPAWQLLRNALEEDKKLKSRMKKKTKQDADEVISFEEIKSTLDLRSKDKPENPPISSKDFMDELENYFDTLVQQMKKGIEIEEEDNKIYGSYEEVKKLAKNFNKKNEEHILHLKSYLESANNFSQFLDWFNIQKIEKKEPRDLLIDRDDGFYNEWKECVPQNKDDFAVFRELNAFRNYITRKPYSMSKFKLHFQEVQLGGGWDKNMEVNKKTLIFRKNGHYFLGIIQKNHGDIFDENINQNAFKVNSDFQKMEYKCLGDCKRQIPRMAFAEGNKKIFNPSEDIQEIKTEWKALQDSKKENQENWGLKFDKKKQDNLIEYYKQVLTEHPEKYKENYNIQFEDKYESMGAFFDDMLNQTYKLKFVGINEGYVHDKVQRGELYLFRIYNKDFSTENPDIEKAIQNFELHKLPVPQRSVVEPQAVLQEKEERKRTDNLHTIYFKLLFDKENLKNTVLKLCANAELFHRKRSLKKRGDEGEFDETVVHKKGEKVINKQTGESKTLKRDIIKDRRFTEDKYFLHLPIELNFKHGSPDQNRFNEGINRYLKKNANDMCVIGIDRGEKNLLYYSVINSKGDVIEQGSWNLIKPRRKGAKAINYWKKLKEKEVERLNARKNWHSVTNIKDLKKGYLSLVIHELAQMIIKYHAIVVLEDLNFRFKQIRGGVESSVYQQFEKALIDKLSYLVFKRTYDEKTKEYCDVLPRDKGGALNPYQLTGTDSNGVALKDIEKQIGILFYTAASYTSITDPVSGFYKNIYLKSNLKLEKCKELFSEPIDKGGIEISYINDYFEFSYNPVETAKLIKDKEDQKDQPVDKIWKVCSCVERSRWERSGSSKKGMYKKYNITESLQELFDGFQYESSDINQAIKEAKLEKSFFTSLIFYFNLILQLRNSQRIYRKTSKNGEKEETQEVIEVIDYIQSPVEPFYDSIKVPKDNRNTQLPIDSDANGAYNIARKGLIILNKIKKTDKTENEKFEPKISINKNEWAEYVTREDIVKAQTKKWKAIHI